jgi:hypothetical protein
MQVFQLRTSSPLYKQYTDTVEDKYRRATIFINNNNKKNKNKKNKPQKTPQKTPQRKQKKTKQKTTTKKHDICVCNKICYLTNNKSNRPFQ